MGENGAFVAVSQPWRPQTAHREPMQIDGGEWNLSRMTMARIMSSSLCRKEARGRLKPPFGVIPTQWWVMHTCRLGPHTCDLIWRGEASTWRQRKRAGILPALISLLEDKGSGRVFYPLSPACRRKEVGWKLTLWLTLFEATCLTIVCLTQRKYNALSKYLVKATLFRLGSRYNRWCRRWNRSHTRPIHKGQGCVWCAMELSFPNLATWTTVV